MAMVSHPGMPIMPAARGQRAGSDFQHVRRGIEGSNGINKRREQTSYPAGAGSGFHHIDARQEQHSTDGPQ